MAFKDSTDFYEKMQKIQNLQHEREAKRLKLEQTLNSYLNSDQRLISLKAQKLQKYWKKICQQERMSKIRNETILRDVERLEARLQAMSACTDRLKIIRQQYDDYLEKQYPSWRQQIPYISKIVRENKENINDYLNYLHGRKSSQSDIMDHFRQPEQTDIKLPISSQTHHQHQLYRRQETVKSSQHMENPTNRQSFPTVILQERPPEESGDYYTKSYLFEQKEHYDYSKPLPHPYEGQPSSHSTMANLEQQLNQESNVIHQKKKIQQISPIPFTEGGSCKHPYYFENSQTSAVRDERICLSYSDRNLRYEKYPFLAQKDGPRLYRQVSKNPKLYQNNYQHMQKSEKNDESGGSRVSLQSSEEENKFNGGEIPFDDGYASHYRKNQERNHKLSIYDHEEANNNMLSSSNDTLKNVSDGMDDYMEQYHQDSEINSKIHIHPFTEKTSHYPNRKFKNQPLYTNFETYKPAGELSYRRTDRPFVRFADPPVTQSTPIPRYRDSSSQLSMTSTQETESELSVQSAPPYSHLHAQSSLSDQWNAKPPIHISPARRRHIADLSRKDNCHNIKPTQTESEILHSGSSAVKQRPIPARRTMGNIGNTSQKGDSHELVKEDDKMISETIEDSPDVRGKGDEIIEAYNLPDQDAKSVEILADDLHKFTVEKLVNEITTIEPELGLEAAEQLVHERNNSKRDFPAKNQSNSEIVQSEIDISKIRQNEQETSLSTSDMFHNPKNAIEVNISQDSGSKPDSIQIRRSSTDKFGIKKSVSVNVFLNPEKQNIEDEVDESLSSDDSMKAALSLADLQDDILHAEQTFAMNVAHLDERQISDGHSDSDDSLALQKRHLKEIESEKSDKENSIEERKGLSLTSSLSQEGLFKLLQAVEEKLSDAEETLKFNSSNKPSSDVVENILKAANSVDSLDSCQVEDALTVILQQLPDFIEQLPGGCLFSELLLQQFNIRFTEVDVKNYILSSNQALWEQLCQHFTILVKSKILTSEDLATLFGPLLISSNSSDFERKKAQLILRTMLEFNEDNDSDLSSVTLPSLSQNALPENEAEILDSPEIKQFERKKSSIDPDDSDDSDIPLPLSDSKSSAYEDKAVKNNEKPKKVTTRESDTDDDGDSFFDKVAVPLSGRIYTALLKLFRKSSNSNTGPTSRRRISAF